MSSSSIPRRPTRDLPPVPDEITTTPAVIGDDVVESPVSDPAHPARPAATELSPLRSHYLKKCLIQLQFNKELDEITTSNTGNVSTFSHLGPPFSPPPKDAAPIDLPFLRYIFRQFVLTFPFMASAPKDFYSDKLQPFMASALSRNLSPSSLLDDNLEAGDQATRLKLLSKVERNLSLFVGAATKLVEREEVVRLSQADLDRIETMAMKRQRRTGKERDTFEVNIVGVRTVVDKGRMRSRVHEEFIVRTRRSRFPDVFVSRRYGDFKTLADELRKAHPTEHIPSPPAKDRSTVSAPATTSPTSSTASLHSPTNAQTPPDTLHSPGYLPSKLAREKNRLTLRAYLHSLMAASAAVASSLVLKSFLTSSPTTLSPDEVVDAQKREEADNVREEGRKRFAREIAGRVEGLREAVRGVKGDVMGKNGLTQIFGTIKVTANVRSLPSNYQAVIEWARISLASTVFQQFVAADTASETFAGLKRIHGLMPYFVLKGILKLSNPIGMIRGVLDLFLAQPFGAQSLLQRMFTTSLTEEVTVLQQDIESVKDKVDDPVVCEKIRRFVYAPKEIQDTYKADAAAENMNLLTIVLRSGEEPILSRAQMQRVARAHRAHAAYLKTRERLDDSDDDDGPQDDDAWLFEDLKVLTNMYSRLRDREQLIALIFEGFTAELLKDMLTIFYTPLAQVYKAASIADSLGDLQSFINDLIKTVEQVEELSQEDPHRTVQAFIDLIQRHEQPFYSFVHKVHSKGEGLFDSLIRWIELFLTVIREGLGTPLSLEYLLPHTGPERSDILREIDAVALYHYKLKVIYEDKLRKRFGKVQAQGATDADAEDEATQVLVNGVVGEISFGDLIQGDAVDLAAEDTDEESDDDSDFASSSEEEESSDSESTDTSNLVRPSRSDTVRQHPAPSTSHHRRQSSVTSSPRTAPVGHDSETTPRPRTLSFKSLKHSRSLNFRSSKKAAQHAPPPPLPTLPPKNLLNAAASKPLPPSPSPQSSFEQLRSTLPPLRTTPSSPASRPRGKKKAPETLKPPVLEHIPKLLPVFTEIMRPLLRPRQRTNLN